MNPCTAAICVLGTTIISCELSAHPDEVPHRSHQEGHLVLWR